MLAIFLKTLPFFALIGLGYGAARIRFFSEAATASLTRFVFYFALSAMLFRFSASLTIGQIFDAQLAGGYLFGSLALYAIATAVALVRGTDMQTAAIEAQCAVIGNTGFLGVPMLALLFGEAAIGPIILVNAQPLSHFRPTDSKPPRGRDQHLVPRLQHIRKGRLPGAMTVANVDRRVMLRARHPA